MWMHSSTYGIPIGTHDVSDTQLLKVEASLTNVFRSTTFQRITFYFHSLYRERFIMVIHNVKKYYFVELLRHLNMYSISFRYFRKIIHLQTVIQFNFSLQIHDCEESIFFCSANKQIRSKYIGRCLKCFS